jgi:divalent metal cation (Fe/Co/Zn/Cd) transporter
MVVEGAVAITAGISAGSVALTGFGADSIVELVSSLVVLASLFGLAEPGRAARVVGVALLALCAYLVLAAAFVALSGRHPEPSAAGLAVTVVAIPMMAGLWRWRLRLADRLGSAALRGDAACSAVCLYLSAVTAAGVVLNAALGWWWADAVAGLALIWWIRGEAMEALRAA